MTGQTIDYIIQSKENIFGAANQEQRVRIPAEAKTTADKLLCEAQAAFLLRRGINGFEEFISLPGIHAVALKYGQGKVKLPLASDLIVLGVAEVMANYNSEYTALLSGIINASRIVCSIYKQD